MVRWFKVNRPYVLGLIILVLVVYANALNNYFVSDDVADILKNETFHKFSYVVSTTFWSFRPFLYWLAYQIGGLSPILYRLINVVFHSGNVILIFAIASFLYNRRVGLLAASLFAVHPLIIESVTWISGGNYTQAVFFSLLTFLTYILDSSKKIKLISLLSFFFALTAQPIALSLIPMLFIFEFSRKKLMKNWKKIFPYFLLMSISLMISLTYVPERVNTLTSVHYQEQGMNNPLIVLPIAVTSYLELIFWPKDLTLYHSEINFTLSQILIRTAIFIIFLGMIIYFYKKRKEIFFWLSLFLAGLIPTLIPALFRMTWILAERYITFSIIGIIIPFAMLLDKFMRIPKWRSVFYAIFVVILISLSARTIIRNVDWKNEDNLWIAAGKTSPSSPNNHNNLGDVYGRQGDKQRALQEFQKAIEIKPNYADAYHNLANTYHELKQDDKALENYQKAAQLNPNLWQSYQNIAAIYFNEKKYDKAIESMQKAVQINPKSAQLVYNLGILYLASGQKDKAKQVFQSILSVDPKNQYALAGLAEAEK